MSWVRPGQCQHGAHGADGPQELPPGTTPTDIAPSGASYWARTAKISATNADGNKTAFFIKVSENTKNTAPVMADRA